MAQLLLTPSGPGRFGSVGMLSGNAQTHSHSQIQCTVANPMLLCAIYIGMDTNTGANRTNEWLICSHDEVTEMSVYCIGPTSSI